MDDEFGEDEYPTRRVVARSIGRDTGAILVSRIVRIEWVNPSTSGTEWVRDALFLYSDGEKF